MAGCAVSMWFEIIALILDVCALELTLTQRRQSENGKFACMWWDGSVNSCSEYDSGRISNVKWCVSQWESDQSGIWQLVQICIKIF